MSPRTALAQVALTTTDTIMMGLLGTEALAAGGLALVIFNQLRTMGVGLVTSVGNQIAAAAARAEKADRTGADATDTDGDEIRALVRAAMAVATLASVAVNAALNWGFIHGTFGLSELGLTGIGVATGSVYLLSFLALYASAHRDAELAPLLRLDFWRADAPTVRRLVGLGTPIAATYGSEAGFFFVTSLFAGSFGAAALAAHTAVNQLIYIVFQVAVGLSHAASLNVSRELALGDLPAARRIKNTALTCGAAVTTLVGILYLTVPQLILRPYFDPGAPADQQGLEIATGLLVIVAVLQFFDCAQNIGVGLLHGLDDTKSGFRITLIGYWAVGLPASWLLAYPLGGETRGLWLGLLIGLATTAILLLRRYGRALNQAAPALAAVGG